MGQVYQGKFRENIKEAMYIHFSEVLLFHFLFFLFLFALVSLIVQHFFSCKQTLFCLFLLISNRHILCKMSFLSGVCQETILNTKYYGFGLFVYLCVECIPLCVWYERIHTRCQLHVWIYQVYFLYWRRLPSFVRYMATLHKSKHLIFFHTQMKLLCTRKHPENLYHHHGEGVIVRRKDALRDAVIRDQYALT